MNKFWILLTIAIFGLIFVSAAMRAHAQTGENVDVRAGINHEEIDNAAQGNEKAASLVNAYNAFVLRWILANYPTESIWQLKDSFAGKRNDIGGRKIALNDIEHGTLRPLIGYRT